MFQECYAIADVACLGYLGQKQFKDLLKLLPHAKKDPKECEGTFDGTLLAMR